MSDSQLHDAEFPWKGSPDESICNFAVGDLILNLPRLLTVDGRVHAPTLLAAAGAIAGYAAQQALLSEISTDPAALQRHGLHLIEKGGAQYYFGDPLNERLLNRGMENAAVRLWSLAAGAAVQCGVAMEALPDVGQMFSHVARAIGSAQEAYPSLPKMRPQIAPKDLLNMAWPVARMCFDGKLSAKVIVPHVVTQQRWRPVIAAHAANRFIRDVHGVVGARPALIALFESAIYASKLKLPLR